MAEVCLSTHNDVLSCAPIDHQDPTSFLGDGDYGGGPDDENCPTPKMSNKMFSKVFATSSLNVDQSAFNVNEQPERDVFVLPLGMSPVSSQRKRPDFGVRTVSAQSATTATTATTASSSSTAEELFYACLNATRTESLLRLDESERDLDGDGDGDGDGDDDEGDDNRTHPDDDEVSIIVEFDWEGVENVPEYDSEDADDGSFADLQIDGHVSFSSLINGTDDLTYRPATEAAGKFLKKSMTDVTEITQAESAGGEPPYDPTTEDKITLERLRRSNSLAKCRLDSVRGTKPRKYVTFDTVSTRYYERVISINPACTSGVPIGIGWRYKRGAILSVDEFELQRGVSRTSPQLVLPRRVRDKLMLQRGYTRRDLAQATRSLIKCKNQRKQTVTSLHAANLEEAWETATRQIVKLVSPRSRSEAVQANQFSRCLPL